MTVPPPLYAEDIVRLVAERPIRMVAGRARPGLAPASALPSAEPAYVVALSPERLRSARLARTLADAD